MILLVITTNGGTNEKFRPKIPLLGVLVICMIWEMDHGKKINKTRTPLTSKRPKLPFIMVTDGSIVKDQPIVEDNRLINWKKWVKRHQRQHQALDEGRLQNKTEMVMDSCEEIRQKMEMRNLMEYATISASSVSNKNQGNPGFWKIPPFLSNHGNSCPSEVGPVLTKKELNLLPTLEHVEVPTCIKAEKNLLNPLEKVPAWKCSSYLRERERELADTIAILQPCTPEAASLIARGKNFGHEKENVVHVPVISIMDTCLHNQDSQVNVRESQLIRDSVVSLKINDLQITRDDQSIRESLESAPEEITWTMDFLSKIDQKLEKNLYFENTGTVAITYQWRNNTLSPKFLTPSSKNNASFFFNKNKALILPGQKITFTVWFQKHQDGIFSESWRIETDPIVSMAPLIIRMYGYAISNELHVSRLDIDIYLDRCIRNTVVRETINEIMDKIRPPEPPEPAYKSFHLERKLFRTKNPSYFYHASLIPQFHHLYATASAPDASSWTLSLIDLRRRLLQIENPDLRQEKLTLFSDLCQQCLAVCLFNPLRNSKYTMVYNVLCAMVNRMEEESEFVKGNCILKDKDSATLTETRISSSLPIVDMKPSPTTLDRTTIALYQEVFYIRIYELLIEAVEQACAVIDSLNSLNAWEP